MIKIINFKKIISIFLLLVWLFIIFLFSNTPSGTSEEQSKTIVNHIVGTQSQQTNNLEKEVENETILEEQKEEMVDVEYLNFLIRKIAHMSEYFILSLLVLNVIIQFKGKIEYKHYIISICFCLMYAITDEFHQTFVPGRTGQALDVLIDTFGAILGCGIYKIIRSRKKV